MNAELRKNAKYEFKKDFFNLTNNAVFGKIMENLRKYRDIKFVTFEGRRNYLAPEPNHHTTNVFLDNLLAIEMQKTQIFINEPVYLGLSMLDISKILIYEFWHDYVKPKYG